MIIEFTKPMTGGEGGITLGECLYEIGLIPPHYPVPAKMEIDPLIKNYIMRNILYWLWSVDND
jgi:hypothetical protein